MIVYHSFNKLEKDVYGIFLLSRLT